MNVKSCVCNDCLPYVPRRLPRVVSTWYVAWTLVGALLVLAWVVSALVFSALGEDQNVRMVTLCVFPFAVLILKIRDWGDTTDWDTESVETT